MSNLRPARKRNVSVDNTRHKSGSRKKGGKTFMLCNDNKILYFSFICSRSVLITNWLIIFITFSSFWTYKFFFYLVIFFCIDDTFAALKLSKRCLNKDWPKYFIWKRTSCANSFSLLFFIFHLLSQFLHAHNILLIWQFRSTQREMNKMKLSFEYLIFQSYTHPLPIF